MAPIIFDNKERIIDSCNHHNLKYLYVFGSAARGTDFTDDSDVDFLYAFDKSKIPPNTYAANFFEFMSDMETLLKRKIDLIPQEKIRNNYFLKQVNTEKIQIYGD